MMAARRHESHLRGVLREYEPMDRHVSWRAGGVARRYYEPADRDDLAAFLATLAPDEPLLWLGLGSNLLVRDGGFPGSVIALAGVLDELHIAADGTVEAGAGVTLAKLARQCARVGHEDAAFLAGIPGTLGGALAMNAGCHGDETWRHVVTVDGIARDGRIVTRPAADFEVGYRHVACPADEWFIGAALHFEPGDPATAQARIKELLARRNATQPANQASCGSVFRNPPGDHAARLIEAAGLKGLACGAAQVSERHANFIINSGGARAADIEALIAMVRARVAECHGVQLMPEVQIVGDAR
jgi:UDP-N-acetylmuramate dehydrogenase